MHLQCVVYDLIMLIIKKTFGSFMVLEVFLPAKGKAVGQEMQWRYRCVREVTRASHHLRLYPSLPCPICCILHDVGEQSSLLPFLQPAALCTPCCCGAVSCCTAHSSDVPPLPGSGSRCLVPLLTLPQEPSPTRRLALH